MIYRILPHGGEKISILGLGANGVAENGDAVEIQKTYEMAIEHGINYFDLAGANAEVFAPLGRTMKKNRDKVYLQLHFGADYSNYDYGWTMNVKKIEKSVENQFRLLDTDYVDFGFIHCIDEISEADKAIKKGILDMILRYKDQGKVRHIALSSHNPEVVNYVLDRVPLDMVMFSINPAYDYTDESYGIGSAAERMKMYRRCEKEGVGISVMKPYGGGRLLDIRRSPFSFALTPYQCIQYALDKPGVLTVVAGVDNRKRLEEYLHFLDADQNEKDYSCIAGVSPKEEVGNCVYCNHCAPCPAGIDIGQVNKYYDLAIVGDNMASEHYHCLEKHAGDCISCGHCDSRCPFKVSQMERMQEIKAYFEF